jgi:hypothetical protein
MAVRLKMACVTKTRRDKDAEKHVSTSSGNYGYSRIFYVLFVCRWRKSGKMAVHLKMACATKTRRDKDAEKHVSTSPGNYGYSRICRKIR